MYTWKEQVAIQRDAGKDMVVQAMEHIAGVWGIEDTSKWLAGNEGEEELVLAMEINNWYADGEQYEDMDEEDRQEAEELVAWAQTITTARR